MSIHFQETYEKAQQRRELNERIKQLIVNVLGLSGEPTQISDDQPLFGRGLGLDSLDALELVVGLEEEFEVSVSDDDVSSLSTVNKMADYILAVQAGRELEPAAIFRAAGAR
jgi:acyl carrier protein